MKEFDNYDDLFNYLDKQLDNSLEDLAEIFKEVLYKFVKEKFYDVYTPVLYKRTWEVLNSITVSKKHKENNLTTVDVFFDINKIQSHPSSFYVPENLPRLHHHMDMNGNPTNDIIVFLLNDGWKMYNGQKRQGGKFLQAIDDWSRNKNNWINELNQLLKNKGIIVI